MSIISYFSYKTVLALHFCSLSVFSGWRTGPSVQPNDAESTGLQREPRASPHVPGSAHRAVPAPASSDRLHHGHYWPANGTPIGLPTRHWSPAPSAATPASVPAPHAGPAPSTRLHAAPATTGMLSTVMQMPGFSFSLLYMCSSKECSASARSCLFRRNYTGKVEITAARVVGSILIY